MTDAMKIVFL